MAKGDLKSAKAIYFKGFAFLAIGLVAAALILGETFSFKVAFLLAVCIWSFCRFYYFAFYVIEHYVDGSFRFAGLLDFARYCLRRPRQ